MSVYSFPLPSKAAVYRCEMVVNDRTIRAKVFELEAARRIAKQKKAEGRRTVLVEMERGNLFSLSLGNVQPDDMIVIRFAYFEELNAWKDELALQIPFNPGVRYIPGEPLLRSNSGRGAVDDTDRIPDASRISPPRIDQTHPNAARLHECEPARDPAHLRKVLSNFFLALPNPWHKEAAAIFAAEAAKI